MSESKFLSAVAPDCTFDLLTFNQNIFKIWKRWELESNIKVSNSARFDVNLMCF